MHVAARPIHIMVWVIHIAARFIHSVPDAIRGAPDTSLAALRIPHHPRSPSGVDVGSIRLGRRGNPLAVRNAHTPRQKIHGAVQSMHVALPRAHVGAQGTHVSR